MYKCNHCISEFQHPEIKRPDAGCVNGIDIFGNRNMQPVKFCPVCLSTKIEKVRDKM